jgi:surfactin synthase thioesterase subunit
VHGSPVPVSFLAGTESREIRQVGLSATRRIAGERFEWIEGSHLYPMERPIETARAVQRMLYAMENGA